jgi:hypothetical protein
VCKIVREREREEKVHYSKIIFEKKWPLDVTHSSGADPMKLFASLTKNFSIFFALKLGYFVINDFFNVCYKHAKLTAKVRK